MNLASASLPELNVQSVSWASCRNPMCENFALPLVNQGGEDERYSVEEVGDATKVRCRSCRQTVTPHPNQAVRPVARYFLSLSLPFAACPDSACPNYGANVFESYWPHRKILANRRYRKNRETAARCRGCGANVTVGESLALHGSLAEQRSSADEVVKGVLTGTRAGHTRWWHGINGNTYQARLFRVGARLQSYHAWLNAKLLKNRSGVDVSKMGLVYTRVFEAPLRCQGEVHRHRTLKIIVSVLAVNRTSYVLAAHPYFLPVEYGPAPGADYMDGESGLPSQEFREEWKCIEHPAHDTFKSTETPEEMMRNRADLNQWGRGCYINDRYAKLAHFLVIRKMMSRFKRVCYYSDVADKLSGPAMVALGDDIRERKAEVVLCSRRLKGGKGGADPMSWRDTRDMGSELRRKELRKAWAEAEAQTEKVDGENPWVRFPRPVGREVECRSLWLTRMPNKTFEEAEEPLLYATIQPADTAIGRACLRLPCIDGVDKSSDEGRRYAATYENPQAVVSECSIYFLARNYSAMSWDDSTVPARELGLIKDRAPFSHAREIGKIVLAFRLGLTHAERLSRWLRE